MPRVSIRPWTCRLLEAVNEGMLDANTVLTAALNHLSEDDVRDLCEANQFFDAEDDPDGDDPEDGQQGDDT
jgi:hypothetical protein